jgi:hypothetical protein
MKLQDIKKLIEWANKDENVRLRLTLTGLSMFKKNRDADLVPWERLNGSLADVKSIVTAYANG